MRLALRSSFDTYRGTNCTPSSSSRDLHNMVETVRESTGRL